MDTDIYKEDSDNYPISSDTMKGTFIKGNTFTVDKYEFLVQDVEFEYMIIELLNGRFYDGSKILEEGDIITLREGEYANLEVPVLDASCEINVHLDKLWWY